MTKYIDADKLLATLERQNADKKIIQPLIRIIDSLQQEQPEVDLEKAARHVYESWMGSTMDEVRRDMVELGTVLNARKEK